MKNGNENGAETMFRSVYYERDTFTNILRADKDAETPDSRTDINFLHGRVQVKEVMVSIAIDEVRQISAEPKVAQFIARVVIGVEPMY